ncbi:MAG: GntR family transcriptional regulator [Acidimicrobiales bacterium]
MEIEYLSKSNVVANGIRALINDGVLLPGTLLRQRDLAEQFRVSPTPVREALRQLEAEGFVTNELHRGATVVRADDANLEENFLIRAQLESLAASLAAAKVTDEDLENLESILADLEACRPDDPTRTELNRRFHLAIYTCAGSPLLLSLLNLVWRSFGSAPKVSSSLQESKSQHRDLLDALRKRDTELAGELTRAHIMGDAKPAGPNEPSRPHAADTDGARNKAR